MKNIIEMVFYLFVVRVVVAGDEVDGPSFVGEAELALDFLPFVSLAIEIISFASLSDRRGEGGEWLPASVGGWPELQVSG